MQHILMASWYQGIVSRVVSFVILATGSCDTTLNFLQKINYIMSSNHSNVMNYVKFCTKYSR